MEQQHRHIIHSERQSEGRAMSGNRRHVHKAVLAHKTTAAAADVLLTPREARRP